MSTQRSMLDSSPDENRPIQLITENGFSILRSWEVARVAPPANGKYLFLVSAPDDSEREITVEVNGKVVVQITMRTRGRIQIQGTFWIYAAERRLANYLGERNGYPPGDRLRIEDLDPEDCLLALRWETT
jgi:membrane protein implicated in regulation of membrane protease activity